MQPVHCFDAAGWVTGRALPVKSAATAWPKSELLRTVVMWSKSKRMGSCVCVTVQVSHLDFQDSPNSKTSLTHLAVFSTIFTENRTKNKLADISWLLRSFEGHQNFDILTLIAKRYKMTSISPGISRGSRAMKHGDVPTQVRHFRQH